jgi:hypothetical protein
MIIATGIFATRLKDFQNVLRHQIFLIEFRNFTILYQRCVKQKGNFLELFWGAFATVLLKFLFFRDMALSHWLMSNVSRQYGGLIFKRQAKNRIQINQ